VKGLANRKNELLLAVMARDGVALFEGATALVTALRQRHVKVAVVSASENTRAALGAAGVLALFDAIVDGNVVKQRHLAGKPAPTVSSRGANARRRSEPLRGARRRTRRGAGRRAGHFALVIGVDHHDAPGVHDYGDELRRHGADVVVTSLASLVGAR